MRRRQTFCNVPAQSPIELFVRIVALLILPFIMLIGGCSKGNQSFALKGGSKDVIGHVKWAITDAAGTQTGSGERDVLLGDVRTTETDDSMPMATYEIPLSNGMKLGITCSDHDGEGFGLVGGSDNEDLFSWEWFVVNGQTATKLQESGQLGTSFASGRVSRIDFQTDVSLRLLPISESPDVTNPKWRILILKGSYITFPR